MGSIVIDASSALHIWDVLNRNLVNLSGLKGNYSRAISLQDKLPIKCMKALLLFRYSLDQASKRPNLQFKDTCPRVLSTSFTVCSVATNSWIYHNKCQNKESVSRSSLIFFFGTF